MDSAQVLNAFWSGFDLPAYDENRVPDDAALPRITYETADDSFGNEVALSASLWYYGPSWKDITNKSLEIKQAISRGGKMIKTDTGAVWIKRGTPFAQRMGDDNDMLRRIVINISAEFIED